MKKIILLLACILSIAKYSSAASGEGQPLPLTVKQDPPISDHGNLPKSPVQIPVVYLYGNVLTFDSSIEGCTIQLLDEGENVIFSHFIEENETSLTLPSTLSGTYELQIVRGSITFYAFIEL